tara:strand:- start:26 stop:1435 length:1410 start_codon:yes stop_codon:yes gene_type:complete
MKMNKTAIAILLALSTMLAGCLGGGEQIVTVEPEPSIFDTYELVDTREHVSPWDFTTIDLATNDSISTTWAVFDKNYGGNCCEHYLATTIEGDILNIGGEYPVWSLDRGHEWDTYIPGMFTDTQCRTPVPTNPGEEGLGEGSIVQATNGDIISMSWFPYIGGDGKIDKFYAILYDESEGEWTWCYNRITEPFYDRSWQVEVIGPISSAFGSGDWASLVVSNFWHQSLNAGGQISVDGLNYYNFQFAGRNSNPGSEEVNLVYSDLPAYYDVNKPHKEMRAFPVPDGGLYFPQYFGDGTSAFLDTSLNWNKHDALFPSEYCQIDSSGAIHCVSLSGTTFTHHLSWNGGENWTTQNYSDENWASIEEWEFQANGELDLFVLNVRYQSAEGPDVDVVFHVREYSESMAPDTLTFIGLGDLDSTSGAGNDIRFDFASLGILNDGGVVVAYHDSSDPDPLFAVELQMPLYGPPVA